MTHNSLVKVFILIFASCLLSCNIAIAQETTPVETGVFEFSDWNGPALQIFYVKPVEATAETKLVFVMHGVARNADEYRDSWIGLAEQYNFAVFAPEIDASRFPGADNYNLGGLKRKEGRAFEVIEPLFVTLKQTYSLSMEKYFLFGHSAGAQYVHRFVYFADHPNMALAIAANAGWYTMPSIDEKWPYGLRKAPQTPDMRKIFATAMVVLLGDQDIDPDDENLRRTQEAMRQGAYRFARGVNYFRAAKAEAEKLGMSLKWQMGVVPGVAHDNAGMARGAVSVITQFEED